MHELIFIAIVAGIVFLVYYLANHTSVFSYIIGKFDSNKSSKPVIIGELAGPVKSITFGKTLVKNNCKQEKYNFNLISKLGGSGCTGTIVGDKINLTASGTNYTSTGNTVQLIKDADDKCSFDTEFNVVIEPEKNKKGPVKSIVLGPKISTQNCDMTKNYKFELVSTTGTGCTGTLENYNNITVITGGNDYTATGNTLKIINEGMDSCSYDGTELTITFEN